MDQLVCSRVSGGYRTGYALFGRLRGIANLAEVLRDCFAVNSGDRRVPFRTVVLLAESLYSVVLQSRTC